MLTSLRRRAAALILVLCILGPVTAAAVTPDGRNTGGHVTAATEGLGSAVTIGLPTSITWTGGRYLGITGENPSATASAVVPWCAPAAGSVRNFGVQSAGLGAGGQTFTLYKAAPNTYPATLSYSATALTFGLAVFEYHNGDSTHTVTVAKGDCLLIYNDTTWAPSGAVFSFLFLPS